jgi:hypothetical protein
LNQHAPKVTAPGAAVAISKPVSEEGGRPTDRDRVMAEAERRLRAGTSLPSTLKAFAEQLHTWLEEQPDALRTRTRKGSEVMGADRIKKHVRPLWAALHRSGTGA